MPPTGTQTLVRTVFDQWRSENLSNAPADDAWEIFSSWLLLKDNDLTLDIIQAGVVDGQNDGGIDALYTLLEGSVVERDTAIVENPDIAREYAEGLELELHIIQAKNRESFTQAEVTKLHSVLPAALDLGQDIGDLKDELREEVREQIEVFRSTLKHLLVRRPRVSINISIVSRGTTSTIDQNVHSRAKRLQGDVKDLLPSADVQVNFVGADELWQIYDSRPPETIKLECDEILTSGESYVALAPLDNYINLICEPDYSIRRHLFDANVRDYEGQVAVNKEILATLEDPQSPEFWWLNNGVTILCDDATGAGKQFSLRNIQIVNGLQTSHTVAQWFKKHKEAGTLDRLDKAAKRKILVRIIVADNNSVRDSIIRATNRQTPVPEASLRATDRIQRQIEKFFESKGLFYDRRKGYYKNIGKDPGRIVSISYLGQAMYALAYGRPEVARGKPNSLLAEDARYKQSFDPGADLEVFYWAASVLRAVDSHLRSATSQVRYPERRYLSPFIAYATAVMALQKIPHHWTDLLALAREQKKFSDTELESAASSVKKCLDEYTRKYETTPSNATKRKPFTDYLANKLLSQKDQLML
ncbi:AIPR family protein [Saccharopolyspora sp. WRP15-2]|uniref:AIPR family protein n=1 Tax=Saccharopolyspora oryzae TaxID=2997343 RepID=A0ABT4V094_9PSEU|nr:AIPR family protein [Saccharopolyspora oryzae]MDA3627389.1 AIPR family protein [Saccharopolyspora oryzae]